MKSLLSGILLLSSLSHAAMFTGYDHLSESIHSCQMNNLHSESGNTWCVTKAFVTSTTTLPTAVLLDNEVPMDSAEVVDALISESIDQNSDKKVTIQVANHLELTVLQVTEAVLVLGETDEVTIENISIFYK